MPYGYYGNSFQGISLNWSSYYILLLVVIVFTIWAQIKVQTTFKKYSKINNLRRMTGAEAARRICDANGLHNVQIGHISGNLTDHYDPRTNVINLSDSVYDAASIAAVGVAAHEAGHAVQYATGYGPIKLRAAIVPVTQFASRFSLIIFFVGFLFSSRIALIGFALYLIVAFFQLVTLPVEFNASRRAVATLDSTGMLGTDEISGAKKVLSAAALTYVAAMAGTLLQLLRMFLLLSNSRNNRR